MTTSKTKFSNAMQIFALANTPLFLARKLRLDPEVVSLAERHDPQYLFDKLTQSVSKKPKSLRSAVMPYVYLVALSIKLDLHYLGLATRLDGGQYDWFNYIAGALYQMTPATTLNFSNAATEAKSPRLIVREKYQFHTLKASPS